MCRKRTPRTTLRFPPTPLSRAVWQGHEEFDAAMLRQHEEFTKVRNILKIELGRHEMDTWYFSPFPPEYTECAKLFFCEVRAPRGRQRQRCGTWQQAPDAAVYAAVHAVLLQAQGAAAASLAQERDAAPARGLAVSPQGHQHVRG